MIVTAETWDAHRWPNFSAGEFACSHCGTVHMDAEFLDLIQRIRTAFARPMIVTSGYRCPEYNDRISSTGRDGPHTTGRAADIAVSRGDALDLTRVALRLGVTGLGVNQKGGGRFLHLDNLTAPDHPRPTVWSY